MALNHSEIQSEAPRINRHKLIAILLIAIWLVFWPVLTCDFLSWDDYETISRNPLLNPPTLQNLSQFWTRPLMHLWVPLTYTAWSFIAWLSSLGKDNPFSPLNPTFFHAANLLLHTASAMVVFAITNHLLRNRAAAVIGALLFAIHPVQVEPVAWASGLKDLLCGLLVFTALWQYLLASDATSNVSKRSRSTHYFLATLAYIAAMLAKPTAVATPLLLMAINLAREIPLRRSVLHALPWIILAIPCILWTRNVQLQVSPQPLVGRLGIALDAIAFYFYKLIFPLYLGIDYGRRPQFVTETGAIYFTWLLPALLIVSAWMNRRRLPVALGALAIFIAAVLPVSGIVPFDFQQLSTVADHYLYIAMLGPALAAGWVVSLTNRSDRRVQFVAVTVLFLLGIRSFSQTWTWRDNATFYAHTLKVNPNSWMTYGSLAAAAIDAGQPQQAIGYASRALELNPQYAKSYITLGLAYMHLRMPEQAMTAWQQALKYDPGSGIIHTNLAGLLAELGQFSAAQEHLRIALQIDPNDAQAHLNLGTMLAQTNQPDRAIQELQIAIKLAPRDPRARTNLGYLLLDKGQSREAASQFETALQIDPANAAAKAGLQAARSNLR